MQVDPWVDGLLQLAKDAILLRLGEDDLLLTKPLNELVKGVVVHELPVLEETSEDNGVGPLDKGVVELIWAAILPVVLRNLDTPCLGEIIASLLKLVGNSPLKERMNSAADE